MTADDIIEYIVPDCVVIMIAESHLYEQLSRLFIRLTHFDDHAAHNGFVYRQHGYPSRRRSLVDDAKFETVKNREAKLSWLLEQQRDSEDHNISEEEVIRPVFYIE